MGVLEGIETSCVITQYLLWGNVGANDQPIHPLFCI